MLSKNGMETMTDSLKIECEWWGRSSDETVISQICRGAVGINVGEHCLTRLDDSWGNTIRNRMHVSADTLASWFAWNWWRLRWEPETPDSKSDIDWRISHSIAAAGGGFSWPSILFASDGESIAVAARPSKEPVMGPVRYLANVNTRITATAFENGIDAFMTTVLARLDSEGCKNSELAELWKEVLRERADPELTLSRRFEAICGYDPDEAPSPLVQTLLHESSQLGLQAVEEVAAQGRHASTEVLGEIQALAQVKGKPRTGGFRCHPLILKEEPIYPPAARPWQKAAILAKAARTEWNLGSKSISHPELASLLKINKKAFTGEISPALTRMPLALSAPDGDSLDFYIGKKHINSRRFAACRLLGQWLDKKGHPERLIPATETKTANQQFQRAFAQEFLCPHQALMDRLQTEHPSEDNIEDAADYFKVSEKTVLTTLVNHGQMDREALDWVA